MSRITAHLTGFIKSPNGQHVEHVFLNHKGEYMLHPHADFPHKVSREEVLAHADEVEAAEQAKQKAIADKAKSDAEKIAAYDAIVEQLSIIKSEADKAAKKAAEDIAALESTVKKLQADNEQLTTDNQKLKSEADKAAKKAADKAKENK